MEHRCYTCDAGNPDRIVVGDGVIRVPARFEGPIGLANGGIAVGLLACPALREADDGAVATRITARLHAGVPLDRDLVVAVERTDDATYAVSLRDGDATLVSGRVTVASRGSTEDRADETDAATSSMSRVVVPDRPPFYAETGEHPIPGCFSCGPDNAQGLHIIPRVVSDGVVASSWAPGGAFDDGGGVLPDLITASALDCSSGICMPVADQRALLAEDRFFLLGSLDVRLLRRAPADEAYRVVAQARNRDGRKFFGRSALFGDSAVPYALADALWIVAPITRSQAFG